MHQKCCTGERTQFHLQSVGTVRLSTYFWPCRAACLMFLWFHLSLSPSLCRSCAARSPLWPDDSIQICVLFRRGLRVVRSLLHAAWDKPLSGERKRQRTHHSVRNILRLSGQQAQTQQVVARVSVSSLLLITHWLDWYWGWWDGCQHNVLIYMFQSLKMWQMWVDSYTKTEQIFL